MIKLYMNLFGKNLCILGIYAISDDKNALVKADFWGKLNEVIVEMGNNREILIAGDFNSRTEKKTKNLVMDSFEEEVMNDNGDKLIDVCEQNSLKILIRYFKHEDTSIHMAPRYTGAKINNRLHYCQTKFWFKISRCKSF